MRKMITLALLAATAVPAAASAQSYGELRRDRQDIREDRRECGFYVIAVLDNSRPWLKPHSTWSPEEMASGDWVFLRANWHLGVQVLDMAPTAEHRVGL